MLKIYNAYPEHGEIKLDDFIEFREGLFDTGLQGFGQVRSTNPNCRRANYELLSLKSFREFLKSVKLDDGYVQNYAIYMPYSYKMLEDKYANVSKDFNTFEEYHLNEEAILLFTRFLGIAYQSDFNAGKIEKLFGRVPGHELYLIMPGARFELFQGVSSDISSYEVFQSQNLGKQLALVETKRRI